MNDIAQERFITSLSKSLAENNIECKITGINEITLDFSEHDKQIRADAIDEFANELIDEWTLESLACADDVKRIKQMILTRAEHLKQQKTEI